MEDEWLGESRAFREKEPGARLREEKLDLEPVSCGDATGEEDSSPDMVRRRTDLMLLNRQLDGGKTAVFMSKG